MAQRQTQERLGLEAFVLILSSSHSSVEIPADFPSSTLTDYIAGHVITPNKGLISQPP